MIIIIYRQNAVTGLQEINKLKSNVQDIHVPLEVFELVYYFFQIQLIVNRPSMVPI